jgi:hypothetical protein
VQRGGTLLEQVEDRVVGRERARQQLSLQLTFASEHLLDELDLALQRCQELMRHLDAADRGRRQRPHGALPLTQQIVSMKLGHRPIIAGRAAAGITDTDHGTGRLEAPAASPMLASPHTRSAA